MNRNPNRYSVFSALLMMALIGFILFSLGNRISEERLSKSQFDQLMSSGTVKSVIITQNTQTPTGVLEFELTDNQANRYKYYVSDVNEAIGELQASGMDYTLHDVPHKGVFTDVILPTLMALAAVIITLYIVQQRSQGMGGGNRMMDFGKSRAKVATDNKINFESVAGLREEKEDLEEIVDFLKAPDKYRKLGARIPKGILLVGPPGTGKTLLAKAVAGEARVPFFTISGSDFVEMFVGVGASRVRDLFNDAKRNAPCIVFIDEIDAVARRRGSGLGGSHDEREQTLNQMLVEMDGFAANQGIIVLAATNRVDILDPAILRPGRFDRKIEVGRPDIGAREEILKVHVRNKPLSEDVNLSDVARSTTGFTGADLENLMNESAILAAKENRMYIKKSDIEQSIIKVGIGTEKKSKIVSEEERRITAYHEAGHAILFHVLPNVGPVQTISIIPTGIGAAGYTMPVPDKDNQFNTKKKMLEEIIVSLGGRAAEEIVFDDITTGASGDIRRATATAKAMVMKYGFSDRLGMINYGSEGDEVFIGRDLGHTKSYGESTAALIDDEIKSIVADCYQRARDIILEHRDVLDRCAIALLEKEKLSQQEFEGMFHE